jgi:hypothetical protein
MDNGSTVLANCQLHLLHLLHRHSNDGSGFELGWRKLQDRKELGGE